MTPTQHLSSLLTGGLLRGRHVLVTAHPDDELVSASAVLFAAADLTIVQLTDGVHLDVTGRAGQSALRIQERTAALAVAGCRPHVIDGGVAGREAHTHLASLLTLVCDALVDADAVWTHPYEGGHLDHDSAAWLVQTACADRPSPARLEFASYHLSNGIRKQTFGAFWPDPSVREVAITLSATAFTRKRAGLAEYSSQAHILRKFPTPDREPYRVAPVYDFTRVVPPPFCRWDVKGYLPTSSTWRQAIADATRVLQEAA